MITGYKKLRFDYSQDEIKFILDMNSYIESINFLAMWHRFLTEIGFDIATSGIIDNILNMKVHIHNELNPVLKILNN